MKLTLLIKPVLLSAVTFTQVACGVQNQDPNNLSASSNGDPTELADRYDIALREVSLSPQTSAACGNSLFPGGACSLVVEVSIKGAAQKSEPQSVPHTQATFKLSWGDILLDNVATGTLGDRPITISFYNHQSIGILNTVTQSFATYRHTVTSADLFNQEIYVHAGGTLIVLDLIPNF